MSAPADPGATARPYRVCFVCSGNICRSPMAETVARALASELGLGLGERIHISSAGTGDWHVGEEPDPRTIRALEQRGYPLVDSRARQFDADWFDGLDLIVALDRGHERALRRLAGDTPAAERIATLLSFDPEHAGDPDVPDPYYADDAAFVEVLGMIEVAVAKLLRRITPALDQEASR